MEHEINDANVTRYKTLEIDNIKYRTTYNKKYDQRKSYKPEDPKKILAVIPGTIVKIFVKNGARVKEGDRLMVLDAMKMMNDIMSPATGVIKEVFVTEGERVSKKHLLIEFK